MRDSNDKLTSRIKHKLQNYEVPAGDDLWARIEKDLTEGKTSGRFRRYLYVGLAAAAACFLGFVGFRFLSADKPMSAVAPVPVVADNSNSVSPASETPADQSVSLSAYDIREHVKSRNAEKLAVAEDAKTVAVVGQPIENSVEVPVEPQAEQAENTPVATASQAETGGKERLRLVDPDMRFDDKATSVAATTKSEKSGKGWDLSVAYCNNFASQSSSRNGFSPLMRQSYYGVQSVSADESAEKMQFQNAYMNMLSKNIEQEQQTTVKYDFPVTYTAAFRYRFNDHWALNAGVSYTQLNSEWRSGSDAHFYTTQQKLHYVGVPVSASYTFYDSRYLTLYALAGGSVEKCVAGERVATLFAENGEFGASEETMPTAHPWQFSVMAGAGVQFNITKNYGIFAEPTAACYFDNGELANVRTDRNVNFQLSLGFRYSY